MTVRVEQQYSVAQVAKLLNCGESTVWRFVAEGRKSRGRDGLYPAYKLSHKLVRIPAGAVQRFLDGRRV